MLFILIISLLIVGMRKEWIRSEEEKNKKLNQGEKHRKNKQTKRRLQVMIFILVLFRLFFEVYDLDIYVKRFGKIQLISNVSCSRSNASQQYKSLL